MFNSKLLVYQRVYCIEFLGQLGDALNQSTRYRCMNMYIYIYMYVSFYIPQTISYRRYDWIMVGITQSTRHHKQGYDYPNVLFRSILNGNMSYSQMTCLPAQSGTNLSHVVAWLLRCYNPIRYRCLHIFKVSSLLTPVIHIMLMDHMVNGL